MRRIRIFALGIVSFIAVLMSALLAPGTIVNRALSAALCTVFSFNSTICTVNLVNSSDRVVAATPLAVERNIADWLVQRTPGEFDDAPSVRPGSNPQVPPFPQNPGPNFPVRPDFDNPGSGKTPNVIHPQEISFQELGSGDAKLNFSEKNGCLRTLNIKANDDSTYVESVISSIPENGTCSNSSPKLTANFSTDGNEVIFSSTNNVAPVKIQGLNSSIWRITYKDRQGERSIDMNIDDAYSSRNEFKAVAFSNNVISSVSEVFSTDKQLNNTIAYSKTECQRQKRSCDKSLSEEKVIDKLYKLRGDSQTDATINLATAFALLYYGDNSKIVDLGGEIIPDVLKIGLQAVRYNQSLNCYILFGDEYANFIVQQRIQKDSQFVEYAKQRRQKAGCDHGRTEPPVVTSFTCNGGKICTLGWGSTAQLMFTYEDKDGNASSWEVSGYTVGTPVGKGTISPPNGSGTINSSVRCVGSGSGGPKDSSNSVTVTDVTGLKSNSLSVTVKCQ